MSTERRPIPNLFSSQEMSNRIWRRVYQKVCLFLKSLDPLNMWDFTRYLSFDGLTLNSRLMWGEQTTFTILYLFSCAYKSAYDRDWASINENI